MRPRRRSGLDFRLPQMHHAEDYGADDIHSFAKRRFQRFWCFGIYTRRVVERWSSAAANCTERGQAACFAIPSTKHSNRILSFPVSDDSNLVASGMTELGA